MPGIIAGVNLSQTKAGLDRPISLVSSDETEDALCSRRDRRSSRDHRLELPVTRNPGLLGVNYNGPKVIGMPNGNYFT